MFIYLSILLDLSIDIDLGKSDARVVSDFFNLTLAVFGRSLEKLGINLLAPEPDVVIDVDILAWFVCVAVGVAVLLIANETLLAVVVAAAAAGVVAMVVALAVSVAVVFTLGPLAFDTWSLFVASLVTWTSRDLLTWSNVGDEDPPLFALVVIAFTLLFILLLVS